MLVVLQCTALALLLVSSGSYGQLCNEDRTTCSCPALLEVCYFEFSVQRLITFTRYLKDTPVGSVGKSYYINDMGDLVHIPLPPDKSGCTDTDCTEANTADGVTYRTFIGINGRLPGPTLVVYEGQILVVDVINTLVTEPVTIHWHGLAQFNTPWMDGAEIITQCPIAPGTSFRYIFLASQTGSFWYHSHSGFQRSDGLAGGLIIKDRSHVYPLEFIDNPEEHTLTLLDWQRQTGTDLYWKELPKLRRFSSEDEPFDSVPTRVGAGGFIRQPTTAADGSAVGIIPFWSVLINGLGKHPELDFKNSILKVFTVQYNETYRFRLIGMMGVYALRFSVDGHGLTVIATDGNYIEPVVADYVILHSGERYDVLIRANRTEQNDFWIRAETVEVNFDSDKLPPYEAPYGHEGLAILHYDRGSDIPKGPAYANITNITKTCTEDEKCIAVNCPFRSYAPEYNITCRNVDTLRLQFPSPSDLLPSETPDIEHVLNFAFEGPNGLSSINARAFLLPVTSPQIFPEKVDQSTLCKSEDTCMDGCMCTNILDVPYNKSVRLIFSSGGNAPDRRRFTHPIHLHGHEFQVVAVGYGTYNETTGGVTLPTKTIMCADGSSNETCINPSWENIGPALPRVDEYTLTKDTIMLPALGYVVIEFRSTNPGWWFLHCHMWPHVAEGMAVVVNEAVERSPPPPKGICDHGNFTWTVEEFKEALNFTYTPSPTSTQTPTSEPTSTPEPGTCPPTTAPISSDCEMLKDAFAGLATVLLVFMLLGIALHVAVLVVLARQRGWGGKGYGGEVTQKETTPKNVSSKLHC